ncbi:MAG: zinc-binding dehydrogenase [Alphaproteobacteria bacterium]|nr:zinc-binding dehydrogenase [Alphaproteobacteria bacterium]
MNAAAIVDGKLVRQRRPVPKVTAEEVLVRVIAAGVNRPDLLQRRGLYPPPRGTTDIPGLEIAGEIVALGKNVRKAKKLKIGQKICALVAGGGYAEYCTVPAQQCLPVPRGMEMTAAAGLCETFFTVWTNLVDRGQLKKGETLLVHGGASGIGTTAIQVARALGAKVIVTAGTEGKCKACKKLGARRAINYNKQDFVAETVKETKGRGVDVLLDMVGGDYIARNLVCMARYGRHVSIAMQKGRVVELDLFQVMSKRLVLTGSTLRPQTPAVKGEIAKALRKNIWPLLSKPKTGRPKIAPVIDRVFALAEAQAAHDYLEAGRHVGKVILQVG